MSSLKSRALFYIATYGLNYHTTTHQLSQLLSSQAYPLDDIFDIMKQPEVQSKSLGLLLFACSCSLRSYRLQVNEYLQKIGPLLFEELKVFAYDLLIDFDKR